MVLVNSVLLLDFQAFKYIIKGKRNSSITKDRIGRQLLESKVNNYLFNARAKKKNKKLLMNM